MVSFIYVLATRSFGVFTLVWNQTRTDV